MMTIDNLKIELKVLVERYSLACLVDTNTSLGILRNSLLEEIGLALQRYHFHPVERVRHMVVLTVTESNQQSVGAELDILGHHLGVHSNELYRQCLGDKHDFNLHSPVDDFTNSRLGELVDKFREKQASEIAVQTFIP